MERIDAVGDDAVVQGAVINAKAVQRMSGLEIIEVEARADAVDVDRQAGVAGGVVHRQAHVAGRYAGNEADILGIAAAKTCG